jgi:uncharacterized protein (DUF433 family)
MDWSGCELVEVTPGKNSDDPSDLSRVRGTQIPADAILGRFTAGSAQEEIAATYPSLSLETVRAIVTYGVERLGSDTETLVDWSACSLVERVPGRCSGAPTVVGTRIFPDTIAKYYWSGATVEEIGEDYGHEAATAVFMGWSGIQNGALLGHAESNGFDVFVTADRKMKDSRILRTAESQWST